MTTKSRTPTNWSPWRSRWALTPRSKSTAPSKDRDIDEIALEVANSRSMNGANAEGTLIYLKRAPAALRKWKNCRRLPRNIDREIVDIMHRTHMGVDQDYKNLMLQGTRASLADGWGGSMIATDLQDIMFGTPYPLQAEANLGIMKEDHVNIIVHGHEPVLSEMIVAAPSPRK
jgi:anaerobic carbon-monoxide dehydrogenase catalytic subunit